MEKMPGRNGGTLNRLSKGETANPNGRPKKLPELDVLLADVLGAEDETGMRSEAREVLNALLKQAKKGNVNAATAILNRAYGMPVQRTENKNTNEFSTAGIVPVNPDQIAAIEKILNGESTTDIHAVPGERKAQK
jgi:hypothetical protein